MKMKKLLLVGSNGAHTSNFYQLIADQFESIQLFTDKPSEEIPSTVFDFSLKNFSSLPRRISALRRAIAAYDPEVIHVHQANAFAFMTLRAAAKLSIPVVTTLWGSDVLIMPKRNALLRRMFRYIIENSNALTADATVLATEAQLYSSRKIQVEIVNYGIDFLPVPTEKENLIYSNRLHKPLYRIDKILSDFLDATPLHPHWKLLIAATGPQSAELKKLAAADAGAPVEFCGWLQKQENIANYAKSKIYVSIPESDGTSISLLEAMYYGCLPIVSDLPANREWITDGENGLILNPQENVFDRIDKIDLENARAINRDLILAKADKKKNKQVFMDLYKNLQR